MRKVLTILICLLAHYMARGQTSTDEWRYWFDEDPEHSYSTFALANGTFDIDVSALPEGMHWLHLQALRGDTLSAPITRIFTKTAPIAESDPYDCLAVIDGSSLLETTGTMDNGRLECELDVSSLSPGLHTIQVMSVTPEGVTTSAVEKMFVRELTTSEEATMRCCYSIDNGEVSIQDGTLNDGQFHFDLDVSTITDGIHELNYWLVASNGTCTTRCNAFFIKTTQVDPATTRCYYTVDNVHSTPMEGTLSDGVLHFDLDVSSLSDGLHEVSYWVVTENGSTSSPENAFFIKVPEGGPGIIEYEYWLNDDFEHRQTITLDERVDPLSVVSFIDVEPQDFSSSSFDLAIVNGQPTLIAVNDLHLRFTDIGGRMTDVIGSFTDSRVSEEIETSSIIPLEPQHTVKVNSPAENQIQWFSVTAEEGDSLLFRAGSPCMLQLFSPTGEKVYDTNGSTSTSFGGVKALETGTYYLALHDMESNDQTVAVTYRRPELSGIGDINSDGDINISDVTVIINFILGININNADIWNADINNDGDVNITDVTLVINFILGVN